MCKNTFSFLCNTRALPDLFAACLKDAILSVTHGLGTCNPQCMQKKIEILCMHENFFTESQPKNLSVHNASYVTNTDKIII